VTRPVVGYGEEDPDQQRARRELAMSSHLRKNRFDYLRDAATVDYLFCSPEGVF
jgi:hypothetical protein